MQTVPHQLGSASSGSSPSPSPGSPQPPDSHGMPWSCLQTDGTGIKQNRDRVYHQHPILWKGLREVPKVTHGLGGEDNSGAQVPAATVWCSDCGATFPLQWPTEQDLFLGPTSKGVKYVKEIRSNFFKLRKNCFSSVYDLLYPLFLYRRYYV